MREIISTVLQFDQPRGELGYRARGFMSVLAAVVALSSPAAFSQEATPPQVTEKAVLVHPVDVQWESCSPEDAKPEQECEYSVLSGDTERGASGMYVRLPIDCAAAKHWHSSPMHLVGIEGEFVYIFEDGTETSLTPGAYVFLPAGKIHAERCGSEGALFYLYFEEPVDEHMVAEEQ